MGENSSVARALFVFFATVPYAVFRVLYFFVSLPGRLRRMRHFQHAVKHVAFERVCDEPLTLYEVVERIHVMRMRDGQVSTTRSHSMFTLLESLWEEGMRPEWKIPTVLELMSIRDYVILDMETPPLFPRSVGVWAIAEDSHTFVLVDLYSGKHAQALPKLDLALFAGKAPDSLNHGIAYAVSASARCEDEKNK